MENFIVAFNVVMPLFILIGLGYCIKILELVTEVSLKELNLLVFKVFLPVLLFNNMYHADLNQNIGLEIVLYSFVSVLLIFVILCVIIPRFERKKSKASTMIQGMYRSNFALFGIAVTESMYGVGNAEITSLLVAIIVPLFNVLAVCLFEFYKGDTVNVKNILIGIIKNPLIIGTVLGLICKLEDIVFPMIFEKSINTVGSLATPIALIVLGGTFTFEKFAENRKRVVIVTFIRLIVIPFIFVTFAILLGFRNEELFTMYIMFGSPTAVASFAMANAMGGDGELAGQIVVLTTVTSLFSCMLGIFVMKYIGVI